MNKKKLRLKKNISKFITKVLLSTSLILIVVIIKTYDSNLFKKIKDNIFNKSISFTKINKLSEKILGKDIIYSKNKSDMVSQNTTFNNSIEEYFEGEKIKVDDKMPIGLLTSGIVVYIGEKEHFNSTVIVQGIDGYNIWYANIENTNVKLYSYLEKNELIGNAKDSFIYLLIEKDDNIIKYEDYIKNKN